VKRIDILPDDILLEIFDFYLNLSELYRSKRGIEAWQSLAHVCRRWRNLVLGSPRRLNLRLFGTPQTPAKDTLDIWPTFPLLVVGNMSFRQSPSTDNVIASLGQSNRVCDVSLVDIANWQFENVMAAMQVSFPALTVLQLSSHDETLSTIINHSRFVPGWICSTSTILLVLWHSFSGIANSTFVCYSPRLPLALQYSSFRVLFTRSDGRSPFRVVEPQNTFPSIPFSSISSFPGIVLLKTCNSTDDKQPGHVFARGAPHPTAYSS
jgi:F-box-like